MTDEQLEVAKRHVDAFTQQLGFSAPNLRFVKGYIEDLKTAGIDDESVDMIISNCVVNLSPNKPAVLREAFRVLAAGGELYFSDVYCDRRLPKHVQEHEARPRAAAALLALSSAVWCLV
jgi:arsenite methyltransferase